jgi:hypothetical protein
VPHRQLFSINKLILFKEMFFVHTKNHTKHTKINCLGKMQSFWLLKQVAYIVIWIPIARQRLDKQVPDKTDSW